jgi:DNA repair protein RecO (recombination protein O)
MTETDRAILLRRARWSETSLVITWFSANHGKLKTVAKGALRPKNRFGAMADLFFLCEIQWQTRRNAELGELREIALLDPHDGIRAGHRSVALASYMAELADHHSEPGHNEPALFDLLCRAYAHVATVPATLRALTHFERELTRILGIHDTRADAHHILRDVHHNRRLLESRRELLKVLPES